MPMYGSVFHEAIPSPPPPPGQSLSLALQPGWLGLWGLLCLSPSGNGGHLERSEVPFFLSLLMWKFYFLVKIISFLLCI